MFIPANILQPILENAFVHGINCLADESGKIDISAEYSDELLRLRVVDNAGMFNSEKYASRSRSALGILSDQIKLYYKNNEKCKISICGDQTKTTVEVVVTGGRG